MFFQTIMLGILIFESQRYVSFIYLKDEFHNIYNYLTTIP